MKKAIIFMIDFYRNYLSNLKLYTCRFHPTCSLYTREAIEKKGIIRGACLGFWRILRCNPFSLGGHDPLR